MNDLFNKPESPISSLYFKVIQKGKDAFEHLCNKLKELQNNKSSAENKETKK